MESEKGRRLSHAIDRPLTPMQVYFFLFFAVLAVFGQTVRHGFLLYDDREYVYANAHISGGLSGEAIRWAFTHTVGANWHPVTLISHLVDCTIFGLNPAGHHLMNVLLHAVACCLLFRFLFEVSGALRSSALVATVFAIHPLRAESVAWIAERKDVLSCVFFVLTLLAYLSYVRHSPCVCRYLTVVMCFALGLLSKPMGVTTPCVLLLLDYWPLKRAQKGWVPVLVEKIPLFLISAVFCLITVKSQGTAVVDVRVFPVPLRLANAVVSYAVYIIQFLFPIGLGLMYPYPSAGVPLGKLVGALIVLVPLTVVAVRSRDKHPYGIVGWLWFLVMLLPVIGLIQAGHQAHADRYTYLPDIGLCLVVLGAVRFALSTGRLSRSVAAMGGLVAIAGLMIVAFRQTTFWQDDATIWAHTLAVTSENYVAENQLALGLAAQGRFNEAVAHYEDAIGMNPAYADAYNNLGILLAEHGVLDQAIGQFQHAIELSPDLAQSYYNMGQALRTMGRRRDAIEHFRRAVELNPGYERARDALAQTLSESEKAARSPARVGN